MSSHAAKIENSDRLKKLLRVLDSGEEFTTAELQTITNSMAIHSDVHELRQNGYKINCRYSKSKSLFFNRKVFCYKKEVKIS